MFDIIALHSKIPDYLDSRSDDVTCLRQIYHDLHSMKCSFFNLLFAVKG